MHGLCIAPARWGCGWHAPCMAFALASAASGSDFCICCADEARLARSLVAAILFLMVGAWCSAHLVLD